ncbi:hypothetical protein IM792_10555 [Mucilaginibacter sp. JRF]|uniref:hypothetical protein n=1 Tax=Mucilaginibacter sp. JRF TaxID=2780088 RepID=UPI00187FCFE6|nr:hypothetical protein [Mucilaginibacter sp. JRF]MBE9584888.1 hypothetical protein [Mucilaginibacter sp. JRF]
MDIATILGHICANNCANFDVDCGGITHPKKAPRNVCPNFSYHDGSKDGFEHGISPFFYREIQGG